jgi:hypothetical protein
MTKLTLLLYVCVGEAWAGASLAWVGAGLTIWGGSKNASAAVFSAVGAVIFATTITAIVGWLAWWMRRN